MLVERANKPPSDDELRHPIRAAIGEMGRVLLPGSYAAIVLGDVIVSGVRTEFYKLIQEWALADGFAAASVIKRPILGGYARLRYEYIVLLEK